jgi:hypothetical protein
MQLYQSQAGQDQFILKTLKYKNNGYFLEIGSNNPININNTFILEYKYNWTGLMVEYDKKWEADYIKYRPKSKYIINDATKIDYKKFFEENNYPKNMDYLQIDLEVNNGSTINTLQLLNNTILDDYKFAVVTFEHDIYSGNFYNTRTLSRDIFDSRGYIRVFPDVQATPFDRIYPFEDWYLHPDLIDINYINNIKKDYSMVWSDIINIL